MPLSCCMLTQWSICYSFGQTDHRKYWWILNLAVASQVHLYLLRSVVISHSRHLIKVMNLEIYKKLKNWQRASAELHISYVHSHVEGCWMEPWEHMHALHHYMCANKINSTLTPKPPNLIPCKSFRLYGITITLPLPGGSSGATEGAILIAGWMGSIEWKYHMHMKGNYIY